MSIWAIPIRRIQLKITAAHWLFRLKGEQDYPAMQIWMRATAAGQKQQGIWQILHEPQ